MKKALSLLLAVLLLLSVAACTPAGTGDDTDTPVKVEIPEWLNVESEKPLVKEGYEKTLRVWLRREPNCGPVEESWVYKYMTEVMNLNLEVTEITGSDMGTKLSLAFGADELPDIMIGFQSYFTAARLTQHGEIDGQLVNIAPYITEELMPNLYRVYDQFPNYRQAVTTSQGAIYGLGLIMSENYNTTPMTQFINYELLEKVGKKEPQTINEFLDTMRAIKKLGTDMVPIGGGYGTRNGAGMLFLNGLGYLTTDPTGKTPAIRNGKVVIPAADSEAFGEYLKIMKTCYDEGLISPSYFSITNEQVGAGIVSGKTAFLGGGGWPYQYDNTANESWWGMSPLTSDFNSTRQWPKATSAVTCGGFVITSACPEELIPLACRFADLGYLKHNYNIFNKGPLLGMEDDYLFGLGGWYYNDQLVHQFVDMENNPGKWKNLNDYLDAKVHLWYAACWGYFDYDGSEDEVGYYVKNIYPDITNVEDPSIFRDYKPGGEALNNVDYFTMAATLEVYPHITFDTFPGNVFLSEDLTTEVNDLNTAVKTYIDTEVAKFITGARPLTDAELKAYFDKVNEIGGARLLEIYTEYYNNLTK